MNFDQPFIKLPICFDAETLEREVRALPSSAWVPHPTGYAGNEAVRLVTVRGEPTDEFRGPMRPAKDLARVPYIQEVMAELGGVWSRSRLMGLAAHAEVPLHVDTHYHWRTHIRIHIPVITGPKVLFTCGDETVHMAAGECWLFDSFRWHRVHNGEPERRVHLVLDTVLTDRLRSLMQAAQARGNSVRSHYVAPGGTDRPELKFEQFNVPSVMSPWEIRCHVEFVFAQATPHPALAPLRARLDHFADSWAAVWAQFEASADGASAYQRLRGECRSDILPLAGDSVVLKSGVPLRNALDALIFVPALIPALARPHIMASAAGAHP